MLPEIVVPIRPREFVTLLRQSIDDESASDAEFRDWVKKAIAKDVGGPGSTVCPGEQNSD